MSINIPKFTLIQTCGACPEAYDVYNEAGTELVGDMRLRHGNYTVRALTPNGEMTEVFRSNPQGDGIFDADEREGYLTRGKIAIARKLGYIPGLPESLTFEANEIDALLDAMMDTGEEAIETPTSRFAASFREKYKPEHGAPQISIPLKDARFLLTMAGFAAQEKSGD